MSLARQWGFRIAGLLAGALFLALLASLSRVPEVPSLFMAGLGCLVVAAALRPANGLLLLAAGVPIATWAGRQWYSVVAWPETLVVAFCAGYCLRAAVTRPRRADVFEAPVVMAAAIVGASLVSQLLIESWRFGSAPMREWLSGLFASGYFVAGESAGPIDAAMRLLESLVLFRAAATTIAAAEAGTHAALALRTVGWIVVGASLASAVNLLRLWEAAARSASPAAAFVSHFLTQRFNVHYGDVNAAGSYFVLALFAALALTFTRGGRRWTVAAVIIAGSIWITSSRAALMFAVLAALVPAAAAVMHIRRRSIRRTTLVAAAVCSRCSPAPRHSPSRIAATRSPP